MFKIKKLYIQILATSILKFYHIINSYLLYFLYYKLPFVRQWKCVVKKGFSDYHISHAIIQLKKVVEIAINTITNDHE